MAVAAPTITTNIDGGDSLAVFGTSPYIAGSAITPDSSFPGTLIIDGGDSNG